MHLKAPNSWLGKPVYSYENVPLRKNFGSSLSGITSQSLLSIIPDTVLKLLQSINNVVWKFFDIPRIKRVQISVDHPKFYTVQIHQLLHNPIRTDDQSCHHSLEQNLILCLLSEDSFISLLCFHLTETHSRRANVVYYSQFLYSTLGSYGDVSLDIYCRFLWFNVAVRSYLWDHLDSGENVVSIAELFSKQNL